MTAALGGVVRLQPDSYQPASSDVIRLNPDVQAMRQQQGYVCCEPLPHSVDDSGLMQLQPLHFTVQARDSCRLIYLLATITHLNQLSRASCAVDSTAEHRLLFPYNSMYNANRGIITTLYLLCIAPTLYLYLQVMLGEHGEGRLKALTRLDSPVPGELVKTSAAAVMECTIRVSPTVVLTNALPYYCEGLVVALAAQRQDAGGDGAAAMQPLEEEGAFRTENYSRCEVPCPSPISAEPH